MEGRDTDINNIGGGGGCDCEAHQQLNSVPSICTCRRRNNNMTWPDQFLEELVVQVAINANRNSGPLAAASALCNLFQVCSTWRAISRSNTLWQKLSSVVWGKHLLCQDTRNWRDEYIYHHRVIRNIVEGRYTFTAAPF